MDFDNLPEGWIVKCLSDSAVATFNPKKSELNGMESDTEVTFVPMSAVDDGSGTIARPEIRQMADVKKGYTYFKDADVIFAKITPCMENGKSAIASRLRNGIGFGSTEFHVVRAGADVLPAWLHLILRSKQVRDDAENAMQGAAGQQRVPIEFLKQLEIPVPPLAEQRRIVARVEALTSRLDQASQARQVALAEADTFLRSAVARAFSESDESSFRPLGEVTGIIGGNSIPENAPPPNGGEEYVGLMKVSDMNASGNEHFIVRCKLETSRPAAVARKLRIVPVGAVVFPKRGGAIATNKKRVLSIPAALDPNMMGVYPLPESGLTSDFLFWWFESLDLAELQEDGGIPQVNKKHFDPLPIPVLPGPEQHAIVAHLNALRGKIDELQRLQREVETELTAFTPALLAKAFRGEL